MASHAKQVRTQCESGIASRGYLQDFDFHVDEDFGKKSIHSSSKGHSIFIDKTLYSRSQTVSDQLPTLEEMAARRRLFEQVDQAFAAEPSLSGVIHGLREIKLGKRGGGRASNFPSKKNAKAGLPAVAIRVESRAESMFALELERNPLVRAFRTQAIELLLPGATSPIFPDFLYVDVDGKLHVREVKANKEYLSPEFRERIEIITGILYKAGISYAVVDLTEMPSGMKSANLFWLHKQYDRIPIDEEIQEFLSLDFERSTYGELQETCRDNDLPLTIGSYLLFTEQLKTNWKFRIDNKVEVWR